MIGAKNKAKGIDQEEARHLQHGKAFCGGREDVSGKYPAGAID
jgi:hypothetical protein